MRIINGSSISSEWPKAGQPSVDVCIIGTGPAGITAAWELHKAGKRVLLVDGGPSYQYDFRQSWPLKPKFYSGVARGLFLNNETDFLVNPSYETTDSSGAWERERVYGGTSTHWGGQSRPLDEIDFSGRAGFPTWPIRRCDLDPYYARASKLYNLYGDYRDKGFNFSAEFWNDTLNRLGAPHNICSAIPQVSGFDPDMYQFMAGTNFATRAFDGQTIDQQIQVIVNANLLKIEYSAGAVTSVKMGSTNEDPNDLSRVSEFNIHADQFVLACGAVENARLLLLSELGGDDVGRYFMCHTYTHSKLRDPQGIGLDQVITTTKTYLSDEQLNLMSLPGDQWQRIRGSIPVGFSGRFTMSQDLARQENVGRCWYWGNRAGEHSHLYQEMTPNPKSRIILSTEPTQRDIFGLARTEIDWQLGPEDERSYRINCDKFNEATGGALSTKPWSDVQKVLAVNGHHIGTTRMCPADNPKGGVVDKNLKVHGLQNLYVAGSSVFLTTGVANPTFTIIALSIRLADTISGART